MNKIVGRLLNKALVDNDCQTDTVNFDEEKKLVKEPDADGLDEPLHKTFNVETAPNTPAKNLNHYYNLPLSLQG